MSTELASRWIPVQKQARKVEPHSNGGYILRRSVVEVPGKFVPGLFLFVDDLVPFLAQPLIQVGVLQGDGRLIAEDE